MGSQAIKTTPQLRFKGYTDEWEEKELEETAKITMGQSPNGKNYTNNPEDYILVQGNADMKNHRVFPRIWTTQITKIANKNDLIMSVRAPVGDVGKTDYTVVIGRGVSAIKGNDFIYQLLIRMNVNGYWKQYSSGSTFESINSNDLKEALLTIPQLKEQIQIGNFFKNVDDLINQQDTKIQKLKNIKKALLEKMFPQNGEILPQLRFKGYTDEWEEKEFIKEVELYTGLTYSPSNIVKKDGTLVLRSSNVQNHEVVTNDNVYVKNEVVNSQNVNVGDIIVVVRNGSRSLIGKHAQIKISMSNTVIGAFMTGIHAKNSNFINSLLDTTQFNNEIEKNLGATINQITTGAFKQMMFAFPKVTEQTKIGNLFKNIDDLISQQDIKLKKLKNIKKALLEKMFI